MIERINFAGLSASPQAIVNLLIQAAAPENLSQMEPLYHPWFWFFIPNVRYEFVYFLTFYYEKFPLHFKPIT